MLRTPYAKLGSLAYKAMRPFLKFYMGPNHHRVRVLLVSPQGEILLVRNWLGHQLWSLPGGGIRRLETPKAAALRELYEETGLALQPHHIKELGSFPNPHKTAPFTIACFTATVDRQEPIRTRMRRLELLDSAWFPLTSLPHNYSPVVDKALALHRT